MKGRHSHEEYKKNFRNSIVSAMKPPVKHRVLVFGCIFAGRSPGIIMQTFRWLIILPVAVFLTVIFKNMKWVPGGTTGSWKQIIKDLFYWLEDEENLHEALKLNSKLDGFNIHSASTGRCIECPYRENISIWSSLDVMLPRNGWGACDRDHPHQ